MLFGACMKQINTPLDCDVDSCSDVLHPCEDACVIRICNAFDIAGDMMRALAKNKALQGLNYN